MKEKLHNFLQSGVLEKYLIGETSMAQNIEVEHMIATYSEIADAYNNLQQNLEIVARVNAVEAPQNTLDKILKVATTTPIATAPSKSNIPWYSIVACAAALLFALSSTYLFFENRKLTKENMSVANEISSLKNDINNNNIQLTRLTQELDRLNNPDSEKYVLRGNGRAKDLKTVAYINPVDKTSMIDIVSLPKLPENQYYQIRAELEDKMVSLGILDDSERRLQTIPYLEDALALSITIKNKNESSSSEETEVAEIALRKDD